MPKLDDYLKKEEVILKLRPSIFAYIGDCIYVLLIAAIVIFIYRLFSDKYTGMMLWILYFILAVMALFILYRLAVIGYKRMSKRYLFTKDRIISSEGIFNEELKSIKYANITDMNVHQTFKEKLLNIGTINIDTAGTNEKEMQLFEIFSPHNKIKLIEEIGESIKK